jgi:hypothetical protein
MVEMLVIRNIAEGSPETAPRLWATSTTGLQSLQSRNSSTPVGDVDNGLSRFLLRPITWPPCRCGDWGDSHPLCQDATASPAGAEVAPMSSPRPWTREARRPDRLPRPPTGSGIGSGTPSTAPPPARRSLSSAAWAFGWPRSAPHRYHRAASLSDFPTPRPCSQSDPRLYAAFAWPRAAAKAKAAAAAL